MTRFLEILEWLSYRGATFDSNIIVLSDGQQFAIDNEDEMSELYKQYKDDENERRF